MRRQLSIFLVCVAFAASITFTGVHASWAQQPADVKITTIQLKQQQMGIGIDRLAKYITANLGSKVRVRTYPAAQLYSGQEEVQAIMKGEIQLAQVIGSVLEPLDSRVEIIKLPYLFPDFDTTYKILDGPLGKKLFSNADQKGVAILGLASSGDVAIHNSKHPIRTPDDFKGLKMRSYGPMGAATLKAMGAMAVVSVPEELYTAFQQGMIDGGANPATVFYDRRLYDVQKYVTDAGMLNATLAILIGSRTWWEKLPADIRTGIHDAIQKLIKEQRADIEVENAKLFRQIAAKGCQLYTLTKADEAAWKKALQPVYTEFVPKIGADLVKDIQQEVEKLGKGKR
jgi:C4-dicarboxylate-binding protein DctP